MYTRGSTTKSSKHCKTLLLIPSTKPALYDTKFLISFLTSSVSVGLIKKDWLSVLSVLITLLLFFLFLLRLKPTLEKKLLISLAILISPVIFLLLTIILLMFLFFLQLFFPKIFLLANFQNFLLLVPTILASAFKEEFFALLIRRVSIFL